MIKLNMFERTKKNISIVIPSWFTNSQHGAFGELETFWFAGECLKKMKETIKDRTDVEIIIINNGSTLTDDNVISCSKKGNYAGGSEIDYSMLPSVYWSMGDVVIVNKENLGFAPACNLGVYIARGEYIVIVNNDIIVWPDWLEAMINVFNQNLIPPVGVVMPALLKEISDAHEALKLEKIDLSQNYGKWSPGAEFGSCFMMKKEMIDKIRELNKKETGQAMFYDENFRCGMGEDRWIWQQVRMLGFDTYRCHETRCYHRGNMSLSKIQDRKQYTIPNREYLAKLKKSHGL